jgi:N-acetylneuraminate synthase
MEIRDIPIGPGHPCYIVAEIGINHNGSLDTAIELMQAAKYAGAQAVKFQKRTLELCVPEDVRDQIRYGTPWGDITYWDYKQHLEFDRRDYFAIQSQADALGLAWFASPWDIPSVSFLTERVLEPHAMKIASAGVTDYELVQAVRDTQLPVIMSTGMSDIPTIDAAFAILTAYVTDSNPKPLGEWFDPCDDLALLQCTATYPSIPEELNLRVMDTLRERYHVPIGFSNHSPGLTHCQNAVALGADIVEAHITLDRSGWGSDQASSIEPHGFRQMVGRIRSTELALGDGIKRIYLSEQAKINDLRSMQS